MDHPSSAISSWITSFTARVKLGESDLDPITVVIRREGDVYRYQFEYHLSDCWILRGLRAPYYAVRYYVLRSIEPFYV